MKTPSFLAIATLAGALLLAGGLAYAQSAKTDLALFDGPEWNVNLGTEFPGAAGTFTVVDQDSSKMGKLTYDFSGGGLYVSGVASISTIPDGTSEIHFSVKSSEKQKIVVRLIDATNQCLQYELPYTDAGDWQPVRIDLKAKPTMSFSGANDGTVHAPVQRLWLGVDKSSDASLKGEVDFKGGEALP
jgi:hypothetical protein